jgi:ubiquinone/menaquinone biosynthesis C-methylase UbiE
MAFYDVFSNFYDASLEKLYAESRALSARALALEPGHVVLDLPCGTGQSFSSIAPAIGEHGRLIGLDLSAGMLRRAKARVAREGHHDVRLAQCDAQTLDRATLEAAVGPTARIDRLHVFLGMSVFPDMQTAFERLYALLAPGGLCVLVDVHADKLGVQGWLVNQMARADIRRRFWEPLEQVAERFERVELPYRKAHGGQIMLASGRKPHATAA